MNRISSLSACVLAIVLCATTGCSRKPDDSKITREIQTRFSQDSGLSSKRLSVQSTNGVVTISGNVDNDAQRDAAGRQAASIAGVKTVVNNLQVASAASAALSAPAPASILSSAPAASDSSASAKPAPGKKARKYKDSAYTVDPTPNVDTNPGSGSSTASATPDPATTASTSQPADPAPAATQPPPPPPPAPKKLIIDQGTQITVRLVDTIDSEKNQPGDTFRATLDTALTSDGEEAVPAGVDVTGKLIDVKSASKFAGQSVVVLQLESISASGLSYDIQTDQYRKQGASRGKNTAEKVGGGAVVGSILGGILGGGKGAAIGAAAGAGAGGGVQAASKSQQIKLPPETVLNFTLQAPITVVKTPRPDANRPKLPDPQQ
jgi:BON domain